MPSPALICTQMQHTGLQGLPPAQNPLPFYTFSVFEASPWIDTGRAGTAGLVRLRACALALAERASLPGLDCGSAWTCRNLRAVP